jgi:hypothetical protein
MVGRCTQHVVYPEDSQEGRQTNDWKETAGIEISFPMLSIVNSGSLGALLSKFILEVKIPIKQKKNYFAIFFLFWHPFFFLEMKSFFFLIS